MRRPLLTIASLLSMLLCVGAAVLWVRSYRVRDSFQSWHTSWGIELFSNWGELQLYAPTAADPYNLGEGWGDQTFEADPYSNSTGRLLGFGRTWVEIDDHDGKAIGREPLYWCPHWALVVAFGILPAVVIVRRVRRRGRFKVGLCRDCGYDLRASTERCPECGAQIPQRAEATA